MYDDITETFLEPISLDIISDDEGYTEGQIGKHILLHDFMIPNIEAADIVFIGITECRGNGSIQQHDNAALQIRKQLYKMYYWHTDIVLADLGNIKAGATLQDSYAAIKTITTELRQLGKTVVLLGGSHDCSLGQYHSYRDSAQQIEVTCVDALIDLSEQNPIRDKNFLMEMLTGEPNYVAHYNHLAFQSYYVHPNMLETLDKLRFDFYRVGQVSENIEDMEPILRSSHMLSIDINAIKNSDAPASSASPNGLTGVEACMLSRFAGMSQSLSSIGIYGYDVEKDRDDLTAKQISQMLWYFIDGKYKSSQESELDDRSNFNEYHTAFAEVETTFLHSKRTQRWWMQMPDKSFLPCTRKDYVAASQNEIPDRWLRVQERG